MKICCGTDLVLIQRIEQSIDRLGDRFLNRLFTQQEIDQCRTGDRLRAASLAARFAGKEAIAKTLGTGVGPLGIRWTDLEILTDSHGAPQVVLHANAKARYNALGGQSIAISLAHEHDLAQAQCVMLCEDSL